MFITFLVLAGLCFSYYLLAVSYAGIYSSFLWFWLLAGVGFTVCACLSWLQKKNHWLEGIPKGIKLSVLAVLGLGIVTFLAMECLIASQMNAKGEKKADYVIVLGAQVRGTRITKSLRKRLDRALDYLEKQPEAIVVCTGGQGSGEEITEAAAMKQYLMEKGIREERILMETKSTSTYENLKFSLEIIGNADQPVLIVSNNFHVYRAVHLAEYVGFKKVEGLAASSDARLLPNYMVREALALLKELIVH